MKDKQFQDMLLDASTGKLIETVKQALMHHHLGDSHSIDFTRMQKAVDDIEYCRK